MANNEYDDIINLPHHVSANRPRMSVYDRAAQFSPFAALKGYDDEIDEAARLTDEQSELADARAEELNEKLILCAEQAVKKPLVRVTHFVADAKKSGGAYVKTEARVKSVDALRRVLQLEGGMNIAFECLYDIEFV